MNNFDANKPLPATPTNYNWIAVLVVVLLFIGAVLFAIFYPKKDDN